MKKFGTSNQIKFIANIFDNSHNTKNTTIIDEYYQYILRKLFLLK